MSNMTGLLKFQGSGGLRPNRFQVFDWREKNINLFSALELQKVVLAIFFFIIILVGSFVVVGSQIMVVHEKTPDIAILKAMGATSGLIRLVFTLQGLFVAVIGLVAGLIIGLGLVALIEAIDYQLEASIYLIDKLPAAVDVVELAFVSLGTLACTLLTTQISAGRAAGKAPVAGLRQVD
jgi:lipoprotein-releasing system permease protein